jgi:hypothetical protein
VICRNPQSAAALVESALEQPARSSVAPTAGPSPEVIVTGVMLFKNFDINHNPLFSVPSWPDFAGGFDVKLFNDERKYNLICLPLNQ